MFSKKFVGNFKKQMRRRDHKPEDIATFKFKDIWACVDDMDAAFQSKNKNLIEQTWLRTSLYLEKLLDENYNYNPKPITDMEVKFNVQQTNESKR